MRHKKEVRIREDSWLARLAAKSMGYHQIAMVLGRTIHLHNTTAENFLERRSWVLHELKHVAQYDRYGIPGFLWRYLLASGKSGYYLNIFEVEARNAEKEISLLDKYRLVLPEGKNKNA